MPSHGLLTIGGVIAFVVGGSALYTQAGPFGRTSASRCRSSSSRRSPAAAFGLLITTTAIRTRRMAPRGAPRRPPSRSGRSARSAGR